jgi:diguanylate cyclase (GGDEF)-like protein/PAS domain S-box-containing protein
MERLFHYAWEELTGRTIDDLVPERHRQAHVGHRRRHMADPHRRPMGVGLELAGRRRDGTEFPVDISLSTIATKDEGVLTVAFIRDISDRRTAEAAITAVRLRTGALERRNNEVVLVGEMGNLLQSCVTNEESHDVIARFGERLFSESPGGIFVRKTGNLLEAVAGWGVEQAHRMFGVNDCWALRRGVAHRSGGDQLLPRCPHVGTYAGEYICAPMLAQGQSIGVVHLRWLAPSDPPTDRMDATHWEATCNLAARMAEHVALALANIQLRETLRQQSIRDPLTNLFNRRFLDEFLDRELRRAARTRTPIAVIMADIDHFKAVNDDLGHAVGDALLARLADTLQTLLRGADVACRVGGEEFILVLPDCGVAEGAARAEQLRQAAKAMELMDTGRAITLSLGVAGSPAHGNSSQALLRAADSALYAAKDRGRDRVEVAPSESAYREGGPGRASDLVPGP